MSGQNWWKEALSAADNVSITRIILIAVTVFVLVLPLVALPLGLFTVELAWYLLGLFTSACGLKGGQKIYEVRRELNKMGDTGGRGVGSYSRYNMAKGGD